MNFNFVENYQITGHLWGAKIYRDGREEVFVDDHNVIVSGISVGLSILYSLSGSDRITDFQFDRFQLGTSGDGQTATSSVFDLSGPLPTADLYGGELVAVSATQISNFVDVANQVFAKIPFSNVTRIGNTSVRYTLILDEDAGNSIPNPLNEIGLFMKNPQGRAQDASILVAYRKFTAITKSTDFAMVFRWTLNF